MTRPLKQTSDLVSSLAGSVLNDLKLPPVLHDAAGHPLALVHVATIRALAASVLSQDETKGQRPAKKKKAKKK